MDDLPLVSIITPSFNQARFLEQTMRSVLAQDYPRLQYFVIDGGSSDGSLDIIRRYEDRLAGWLSEPDRGQAEAINKGFNLARGELVAWLNSDDLYLPGIVQKMVAAFQAAPKAGLVYGDVLSIDENSHVFNVMRCRDCELEDLMAFRILSQAGVFMRWAVLEQAGFLDTRFHLMLDHQLWLRMAQIAPMVRLPDVVAAARFHPQAKNIAQATRFGTEAYDVVAWMQTQPMLAERLATSSRRIWAGAHRFNARYLLDGGKPLDALRAYTRSLFAHPPTALREGHRMLFALLSLLGLARLRPLYMRLRSSLLHRRPDLDAYQTQVEAIGKG